MLLKKTYINLDSIELKRKINIGIVIPAFIEKIVILLHGYNSSFEELSENISLENYANDNNMLIAIPNLDNGYYIDRNNYKISKFIARELINYIIELYSLDKNIKKYIAGISMGGYGSMLIGAKYHDTFERIISISGAFIANDVSIGNQEVVGNINNKEVFEYFYDTFSPFDTLLNSINRNPIAAIINSKKIGEIPKIIVTCGTEDMLFKRNKNMLELFDEYEIDYDFFEINLGKHDYKCFDKGLRYAFKK